MSVNQRHSYHLTCDLCGATGPVVETWLDVKSGFVRGKYRQAYGWRRKKNLVGKLVDVCAACYAGKKHLAGTVRLARTVSVEAVNG